MSASDDNNGHHPYSYRADVAPLHEALNSPSPLGNILDKYHHSHHDDGEDSRYKLSPGLPNNDKSYTHNERGEYSIFGEGSIATSVVGTIADGVHHTISHWKILLFGQLISFFLAAAGAASEELNGTCHVSIPLTQTALVGGLLMLLGAFRMRGWCAGCKWRRGRKGIDDDCGNSEEEEHFNCSTSEVVDDEHGQNVIIQSPLNRYRGDENEDDEWLADNEHPTSPIAISSSKKQSSQPRSFCCGLQTIHAPWWYYFCVALVAVEARYFIFLSFKYTSFSFIYLVDALAIPSAIAFSKILLRRSYHFTHVIGGIVCVSGIFVSTISDLKGRDIEHIGSRSDINPIEHMRGDILAISGAVLLGLDDVLSEKMIKDHGGMDELLFMKWFFGLGISVAQLVIFERDSLVALFEDQGEEQCTISTRLYFLSGYVIFQVFEMAWEVKFLGISECALLNLSLLTSDLWATVFSIFAVGLVPSGLYYVALILIVIGIVLYEAGPSPIGHSTPLDIKVTLHSLQSDITEHAANITNGGKVNGNIEMT